MYFPFTLSDETLKLLASQFSFPVMLNSGQDHSESGFDIFSAEPNRHVLANSCTTQTVASLKHFAQAHAQQAIPDDLQHLPFVSGLMGYASYHLGEWLQGVVNETEIVNETEKAYPSPAFPAFFIGDYVWSYCYNHQDACGMVIFSPRCNHELRNRILDCLSQNADAVNSEVDLAFEKPISETHLNWQKSQSFATYQRAFEKVHQYIHAGDCYQTNLTQRFECDFTASALDYYFEQQAAIQTPYSAFISFDNKAKLLCFSPEQFIHIKDRIIESKPIKGTLANTADKQNREHLKNSLKNQAENVMIVDLLRNDLSKVCAAHSVHVPALFQIESFRNVHHMISHIKGRLNNGISEFEAFLSCFPGGSITGAPKVRAMEIIREVETYPRTAYCGSIFYWNDNGHFDSNILIRTIIQSGDKLYCWAGGGIVADSEVQDEYAESLTKVANLTGITK